MNIDWNALQPHMMLSSHIPKQISAPKPVVPKNDRSDAQRCKKKDECITPHQHDTLFWCYYILKYGWDQYNLNGNSAWFKTEQDEKIRLKIPISNGNFLTKERVNLQSRTSQLTLSQFLGVCAAENLSIVIVVPKVHKYYAMIKNNAEKTHKITDVGNGKYCLDMEPMSTLDEYTENWYNASEKFRSISTYKVDDLMEIARKLQIEVPKGTKKAELYELVKSRVV